jgi:methylenetetrahydrofolate reductase (NADPH)
MEATTDPGAEGQTICVELIEALSKIPGVAGAHIMAPANESVVPGVIKTARERLPKR